MSFSNPHNETTTVEYCTPDFLCPTLPNSQEPAFVCTICWQDQPQGSKPKLLGTSARIVCHACWCAVLDLSICWVCGECVVRGDEVVSLGWCFWHRGCFGCLFCKTKMSLPTTGFQNHNTDRRGHAGFDGSEDGPRASTEDVVRRCVGVELEDVPLCRVCKVETAGEERNRVLEKGLETVTKYDGGLSRDRLYMLDERSSNRPAEVITKGRHNLLTPRRVKGSRAHEIESDLRRYINDGVPDFVDTNFQAPLTDGAHESHSEEGSISPESPNVVSHSEVASFDAATQETHSRSDSEVVGIINDRPEQAHRNVEEDVYVSIYNPLNEPAFRPGKTKPLPQWMRLLPNNVHRERGTTEHIQRTRYMDSSRRIQHLQSPTPTTPITAEAFPNPFGDSNLSNLYHTAVRSPATESTGTMTPPETTCFTPVEANPVIKPVLIEAPRHPTFVQISELTKSPEHTNSFHGSEVEDDQPPQRSRTSLPCIPRPKSIYRKTANFSVVVGSGAIHPSLDVFAGGSQLKDDQLQQTPETPLGRKSRARSAYKKATLTPNYPEVIGSGAIHPSLGLFGAGSKLELDLPPHRPNTSSSHNSRAKLLYSKTPSPTKCHSVVEMEGIYPSQDTFAFLMPPTPPMSPQKIDDLRRQSERLRLPESSTRSRSPGGSTQSREYLERYQPVVTGQTNFSKYVPKNPEPILEKIRGRKRVKIQQDGDFKTDAGEIGSKGKEWAVGRAGGADARSNLHQELNKLFGGD